MNVNMRNYGIGIALLFVFGCATTTEGSKPHEMSVAQHEAAVQQEEKIAAGHAAQFDPGATAALERCQPGVGAPGRAGAVAPGVCWTSTTKSTDAHQFSAEDHRRRAADHRAGSAALREAEMSACIGITTTDRDISPFEHTEDIASVTALNERRSNAREPHERFVGATVTFRAVPGMTAELLQRLVDCHLARNAALGHVVPEMPNCPLVPNGAAARVSSTGNGFAVAIRANDSAAATEILSRAQRLLVAAPGL